MKITLLSTLTALMLTCAIHADDWPQWLGEKRDSVWRETGILDKFPEGGPKVLWRTKVHFGYTGPAVVGDRVYLMDYVTKEDLLKRNTFTRKPTIAGTERVLCLDAKTGSEVWKHEYECPYTISYAFGPRCTPTVVDGKVYTLGSEGNLLCLDAKKGTVLWSKDFKKDYGASTAMWGYASHPLIEGNKLFCVVGGKGSMAVAFDKDTGKEIWKSLDAKEQGYSPPTIIEAGGKKQLLIWHGESINGLDPETGNPYWTVPLSPATAMSIMTPRKIGDHLFAGGRSNTAGSNVSVLLKLAAEKPAVEEVWKGSTKLGVGPINMTPFAEDGTIYGVDGPGVLYAVDVQTGNRLWGTTLPVAGAEKKNASSGTAFLVKNGDRFFIASETGHLIIAKLDRKGYTEIDRWKMLDVTSPSFGRNVVWSHPAFANKCVYARNDKEIVCVSLAK